MPEISHKHNLSGKLSIPLSVFQNPRWPPRRAVVTRYNQNGHKSLTPWSILMILVSFYRFSMMPDTLGIVPITSGFKFKVNW